jgi:hypothetical protein
LLFDDYHVSPGSARKIMPFEILDVNREAKIPRDTLFEILDVNREAKIPKDTFS